MGFWTSVKCFRPGPPPRVTCGELARVVRAVDQLGMLRWASLGAYVKFGEPVWGVVVERVRCDHVTGNPALSDEEYEAVALADPMSESDLCLVRAESAVEVAAALDARAAEAVSSAHISLGMLPQEVVERLYVRSEQNDRAVCLSDVSLSIGPVSLGSLDGSATWYVGGAAVTVGGNGYCWPRTRAEVCASARAEACVREVVRVIRAGLGAGMVDVEVRRAWKEIGDVLCGEEDGWGWGVEET